VTGAGDDSTGGAATGGTEGGTGEPAAGLRYAEVRQKSSHNSFQRHESLLDQMVFHRVRSLELDIHHSAAFSPTIAGDWYVYHIDVIDDASKYRRLSQCLGQIAALARAVPGHEVVTLWIDLKDGFIAGHQPAELDALLQAAFGERLLTPAELLAGCPGAASLQAAVRDRGCAWPELAALRGRVIVALTGGGLEGGGTLAAYLGGEPAARAAFVAPDLKDGDPLVHPAALFHNLAFADVARAADVRAAGLVSRVWAADDAEAWSAAVQAGGHHLATNKINAAQDPWASTAGAEGWPFACIEACDEPAREAGELIAVEVESGDLWGTSDDAFLAVLPPAGDVTLTALISAASSHVEPWAKGCLVARQGEAADAAYLAICRPADDHALRVQVREQAGGESEAIELGGIDGLSAETPAFVRLEVEGACARGLGSVDGVMWKVITKRCFAGPLGPVGVVASGHGGGLFRSVYAGLSAAPGGPIDAAMLSPAPLGQAAGAVQDGL